MGGVGSLMSEAGRRGRRCEITFVTTGPLGGHMRITPSGKVVVDRDLAAGVEDHYRQSSDDPRYRTWMTRPEYKSFIGACAVEAYRP